MSKGRQTTSLANLCVDEADETTHERTRRQFKQMLIILGASVSYFVMGMSLTWPNVLVSDLTSDNSTLLHTHLHLEDWQMDMIGSILILGSIPGLLVAGWVVGRLGRRWSLALAALPGLLGWALLALALNPTMMIGARFLDGITCGMVTLSVITYATEIPDISIRGSFGTIVGLMFLMGNGIGVSLGILLTWYEVALVNVGLLLLYVIAIVPCLPESPTFLVINNNESHARKVLRSLRGDHFDLDGEIELLKKMNNTEHVDSKWRLLLCRENLKKIFILTCLFFVQNFSGTAVIRVNAIRILEISEVDLNVDIATATLLIIPICGVFVLSFLVDRIGRRHCLAVSLGIMLIAYLALGFYMVQLVPVDLSSYSVSHHLTEELEFGHQWSWMPLACLFVCIFAMNIGIESLPWHLSSEFFPTIIRSQAMSVCNIIGSVITAASLQLYTPMLYGLTPAGLYWAYAGVSAVGIAFVLLCVPETACQTVG
ncbi:facilitated trehalose transporter Tret1-like [Panulirus ornatus]|uniref:facilitated trehalose transporter Tret1-like n=1 Tax=Panulirus ornatus TaxID=150431 RepID=UPI003A8B3586